jgi:hypothetical protein
MSSGLERGECSLKELKAKASSERHKYLDSGKELRSPCHMDFTSDYKQTHKQDGRASAADTRGIWRTSKVKTDKHCFNFKKTTIAGDCQKLQATDLDVKSRHQSRTCCQMAAL